MSWYTYSSLAVSLVAVTGNGVVAWLIIRRSRKSFALAREMREDHIDAVLIKMMKYRELDRKLTERQPSKDGLVYEAEQVLTATGKGECRCIVGCTGLVGRTFWQSSKPCDISRVYVT